MRIVKSGAQLQDWAYKQADTIEIKKGWRPEDWPETLCKLCHEIHCTAKTGQASTEICVDCDMPDPRLINAGFEACIEAMEKVK